ncbi:unnamed protein product [Adineta steineri]|uniref:Glutaminyl-peptide cyclotransferase n=1 Tax=Adineta steineri TaxID=433720 RepID=A0A814YJJ7_9BILA|nr:unnamed protein product [Adineta steineri]CAF1230430.1 unnamed protein product [Adineta steineri]
MAYYTFLSFVIILYLYGYFHLVETRRTNDTEKYNQYQCFSTLSDKSDKFHTKLLRPLLIKRVSGTRGNAQVRQHIISTLQSTKIWNIEYDTFNSVTPDGIVKFTNIIATLNPTATHRLVLACHYDSKKLPHFIGATDSAVPCAILLDLVIYFKQQLAQRKQNNKYPTLQLIFFDGEEAVQHWSKTDSLYGSRHLATKMRNTNVQGQQDLNQIDAMNIFILLDLIGNKNLQFVNLFNRTTGKYYKKLQEIETQLLRSYDNTEHQQAIFSSKAYNYIIEDDHVPFLAYDVPILHLIAVPFPSTWHKLSDNEDNLDFQSINHFRNIMKLFLKKYLHIKKQFC